jgi:hypothetical protein
MSVNNQFFVDGTYAAVSVGQAAKVPMSNRVKIEVSKSDYINQKGICTSPIKSGEVVKIASSSVLGVVELVDKSKDYEHWMTVRPFLENEPLASKSSDTILKDEVIILSNCFV